MAGARQIADPHARFVQRLEDVRASGERDGGAALEIDGEGKQEPGEPNRQREAWFEPDLGFDPPDLRTAPVEEAVA